AAVVTGVFTGAGADGRAGGGAMGADGTAPAEGRFMPGMADTEPPAVGASGISLETAGRMRCESESDAVSKPLRATTGLVGSCACSSAGLGVAGVEVATVAAGWLGAGWLGVVVAVLVAAAADLVSAACVSSGDG